MTYLFQGKVWLLGGALVSALALTGFLLNPIGCSRDETADPCPGGICTGPGDGGNTDSGVCVESWVCTSFDTAGSSGNQATRSCTDKNNCGTTALKPATAATLPALDLNFFMCNVQPVLDAKCSMQGCHGTETDRGLRVYARGRLRNNETLPANSPLCVVANPMPVSLDSQCTASVEGACRNCGHTPTEWQRNFDSARSFALDASLQRIPAGQEDSSELIAQAVVGGKAHANVHLFRQGDPDYTQIKQWLSGMTLATCNTKD
jgi:hypothetical protein